MDDTLQMFQIEKDFAYVDSLIAAHTNAAVAKVNAEVLQTYWEVGEFVSCRINESDWGDHVVSELADYLKRKNPKRKGYGKRNLYNMVKLYETYSSEAFYQLTQQLQISGFVQSQTAQIASGPIVQMPSAQFRPAPEILFLTSFSNHLEILGRCREMEERVFYILYSAHQKLSCQQLRRCIINQTFEALMSKEKQMTSAMLEEYPGAEYMLKDRVLLDFLGLKTKHTEPQLHSSLLQHMKQFILELGKDFIFIDDEYTVKVGGKDKRIDLLFFHRALQCLVAVELKAVDFEAEFVSKMDLYLEALDRDHKRPNENPSVGIILCPSVDRAEVEYSLCRSMSPTMVAEYRRILVPREVMKRSLSEYCEYLKQEFDEDIK